VSSADSAAAKRGSAPKSSSFPFWAQVLLGLAVGVLLGFIARSFELAWLTEVLATVGSTFVQLLRVIVVPLVLTAIVVSIANLRQVANAARLAFQTLLWFAITALIAVTIGITIGLITNPGQRASVDLGGAEAPSHTGSWVDFLNSIIPGNILGLEASTESSDGVLSTSLEFNVLQLVVIGIALGAAVLAIGSKADPFLNVTRSLLEVFSKLTWWIIRLAPIGTAGLIGRAIADYGWDLLAPLAVFTIDVYVGCLIVLFVVYPILIKANGLSPLRFFAGAWPAIQFAFVSRSSVGTLPLTQRVVTQNLGVSRDYASFAVPIGATTKMDGCAAIYPALAAITVAQLFGVDLGVSDYLLIAFVSVVGSAATAGLTGATVMLTLTLSTLGLPLEGVGLLLAIDPILDMIRTATNVAGQAVVPLIVAKRNKLVDLDIFNSASVNSLEQRADAEIEAIDAAGRIKEPVG
jgi:Na+/H+-dicarboxylate symporter